MLSVMLEARVDSYLSTRLSKYKTAITPTGRRNIVWFFKKGKAVNNRMVSWQQYGTCQDYAPL